LAPILRSPRVLIGEVTVVFDIALTAMDEAKRAATILVKHVPSDNPKIQISAERLRQGHNDNILRIGR
jgi:hypothetical protein